MEKFGPTLAKGAGSEADKVGKATGGKFGKAMLAGVAVVATGAVLATKALYNIGATFDEVSDTIRVGTGATGKALDALNQSAKNVGKTVPANFKDVGTAIADVNTRLGLTGKPLEQMTGQFLELSRITGTDVAANIENVSRVFGDWGVAAEDQSESLDYLFKVSQSTGIGIDSLSQKVVAFGAPMRQFGFSFEESAALMGKWEKEGVNTETIMGGLRAGLGKLAKAGEDPAKAFKEVTAQIKNAGSTGEATAIAIETFGQRAGPDLAAAVREGRFDLDKLMATLDGSSETIMSAGKDTQDFSEKWLMFKNRVMAGLEPLATRVFDALGKGMDWVSTTGVPTMKSFAQTMRDNEKPLKIVAGVLTGILVPAFAVAGVRATASAAKQAAAWVVSQAAAVKAGVIYAAQSALMIGKWAFMATKSLFHAGRIALAWMISMGPIGLVIAAVVGLVAVIVKNWDKIKDVIGRGWDWVKQKTVSFWENGIKPIFDKLRNVMTETIPNAFRAGRDAIGKAWDGIKALAAKPINFVIDTVYNNGIRAGFNKVAGMLGSSATLPHMSPIGGSAIRRSGRPAPGMGAMAAGGAGGVGDLVKKVGGKAWSWLSDKFMGPVNNLLGRVGSSPWARVAGSAGKKLAGVGLGNLKSLFDSSEGDGAAAGPIGQAGRILPKGAYSIGMPYLGYPGHYGADYPANTGTPIYAMAAGKVSRALSLTDSYGRHAYIDHPGGVQTRYAHMDNLMVRAGQSVMPGQMVGTVGSTGNSTGPHLHFEYRKAGKAVNPANLGLFDQGGWLKHGQAALNLSGRPEPVFTGGQWDTLEKAVQAGGAGARRDINVHITAPSSSPNQIARSTALALRMAT